MKTTRFRAGLIATLIALVYVVGSSLILVGWMHWEPGGNVPYVVAFGAIAIWIGLFNWLKPKNTADSE